VAGRQRRPPSPLSPSGAPPAPRLDRAAFEDEFPGASASAAEVGVQLVRTAEAFLGVANPGLRRHELSPSARQALAVLEGAGEPLPAGVVAARLLVTTASMTAVLDTLERRGLVRRQPDPADRRRVLVAITERGRALVDAFLPEIAALQAAACATLSEAEREVLVELLRRIAAQLATTDPDAVVRAAPQRQARRSSSEPGQPSTSNGATRVKPADS
jgi:DNA-binding MarR family transcriptional regulator